jgi:hypothetical protein
MPGDLVEKEVRIVLAARVLPHIVAAERLAPPHLRWAGGFHFYATELVSIVLGWGIFSSPVFQLIAGKDGQISWGAASGASIIMSIVWLLFVLWLKREGVAEKLVRHEGCQTAFRDFLQEVQATLASETNPRKQLLEIAARIKVAAQHHKAGFLTVNETDGGVLAEAKERAIRLVAQFRDGWSDDLPPAVPPLAGAGGASQGGGVQ